MVGGIEAAVVGLVETTVVLTGEVGGDDGGLDRLIVPPAVVAEVI
jgi:hypothetical protein